MEIPPQLIELIRSMKSNDIAQQLVDVVFRTDIPVELEIGAIVLTIENVKEKTIDRIALSKTPSADGAVSASVRQFRDIRIPISQTNNALVKAIRSKEPQIVTDWKYLFLPVLTPRQARDNQAGAGIQTSVVVPFFGTNQCGALIFSLLCEKDEITPRHRTFFDYFSNVVGEFY